MFLLCACRKVWHVNDTMKEKAAPIDQREIVPATCAMLSSWPKASKIGVVKMKRGSIKTVVKNKTIQDLCRYTPSMLYCFAPYA